MDAFLRRVFFFALAVCVAGSLTGCNKIRRARHLSRGDNYYAARMYPAAEIEYLNVLKADPLNSHAIERLGLIYFDEGRLARAYPFVMKAAEQDPENVDLLTKAAALDQARGNFDAMRQKLDQVLQKSPTNDLAPLLLAQSAQNQEQLDQARSRLEQLQKQIGDTPPVLVALGTLSMRTNGLQSAGDLFEQALKMDSQFAAAHSALGALNAVQNNLTNAEQQLEMAADLSPERSSRRIAYADFKMKMGNPAAAQAVLRAITEKAPDYLPAWNSLAEIALQQKDYTNCATYISEALRREPLDYNSHLLDVRLKMAQGDTDKAIAELEQLSSTYDSSPQLHYQLAAAYLMKDEDNKALRNVNQALSLDPDYSDAILLRAQINLRKDNVDTAISSLTGLLQKHPHTAQGYLLLAGAYLKNDNLESALTVCQKLEEIFPKNPQVPLLTGSVLLQQSNTVEARREFEKATQLAPDFLPPVEQLVNMDLAARQYDSALKRIREKQDQWPKSAPLQALLAKVYLAQSETNQAESALLKSIEFDPRFEPAYLNLAKLYVATRQNDKALEKLNQTVSENPRDVSALMLMGMIQDQEKNYTEARSSYEKLLAINPNFSPALNNLAYIFSEKLNLLDKAYEIAMKARDLTPNSPFCEDTLGWILCKRGEYPWALSLLQASAEKLPDEPEVLYHLGMTYYMTVDEERARRTLQKAIASKEDFTGKNDAAARLAILNLETRQAGQEVISNLQEHLKTSPGDPVALTKLAQIYRQQGEPRKAIEAYRAALDKNPKSAQIMVPMARVYFEQLHDLDHALDLARSAYKIAPDDGNVSHLLGRLTFENGDYKWALSLLQQAAQKQPANPELSYDLGMALYSQGRVAQAEDAVREALKADTNFSRTADAKQFLEQVPVPAHPDQAPKTEPLAARVLEKNPGNVPSLMVLATAAELRHDGSSAMELYRKVLKRYPNFLPAMKKLALLEADETEKQSDAYDLAMKVRQELPGDPAAATVLGIVSYRRGDYASAGRFLSDAISDKKDNARALCYLGMCHYHLKQLPQSKTELEKALTMNLPQKLASEAKGILESIQ